MSKAGRETKWISRSTACAAQLKPPVQRRTTSPSGRSAALPQTGQRSGIAERLLPSAGRLSGNGMEDLRDHVARALQQHRVADPHILAGDLVLVVQRGAGDQHAAHVHGGEPGHRRQRAGAADLDQDVLQHGGGLLGRELPGGRPARRATDEAEPASAVRGRRLCRPRRRCRRASEARTLGHVAPGTLLPPPRRRAACECSLTVEPPGAEPVEIAGMGRGHGGARTSLRVGEQGERTRRGHAWCRAPAAIPAAALRGLANTLLPDLRLRLVQPQELRLTQEDTSPRISMKVRCASPREPHRHHADRRAQRRFALTSSPSVPSPRVAPRAKASALVGQRDREPVDLRFSHHAAADPSSPRPRKRRARAARRRRNRRRRTRCRATASAPRGGSCRTRLPALRPRGHSGCRRGSARGSGPRSRRCGGGARRSPRR